MGAIEAVLAAILSLPAYAVDGEQTAHERETLVRPVAVAIVEATESKTERAFLVAQAWHETRFARYVLEDRCKDGPDGAQCDEGRAAGPWQVHKWCSAAWEGEPIERYAAGAKCALRMWRHGVARCKGLPNGGFAAQSGGIFGSCESDRWARRVRTMRRVVEMIR